MFRFAITTPYIMNALLSGKQTNILRVQSSIKYWLDKTTTLTTVAPINLLTYDHKNASTSTNFCSASVYAACSVFVGGDTVNLGM